MHRLMYISTARAALNLDELDELLRVSRRNNAAAGLTGLLIVGGRRFMQVLEGPEGAVRATYGRIQTDPRHFATVVLADAATESRSFEAWSMGFQPGRSINQPGAVGSDIASLVSVIPDANLRAYFDGFARTHAAA